MLIFIISLLVLVLLIIGLSYICFRIAFYVPIKNGKRVEQIIPMGVEYDSFRDNIKKWVEETRNTPNTEFSITSFDGLKLYGKYYELSPGAPIEIMFHGYRGNAERDLAGGMRRAFDSGHSALIVDQRCSGKSGGKVITFGVREYRDCLSWVDFVCEKFGEDQKIILTGISMGASTVLIAASGDLPKNVIGVLADCGYTSAKNIIKKVISGMKLPTFICYPLVKLGARLFGRFNLEEIAPDKVLRNCKIPVILFHGEKDDFVPYQMSEINYSFINSKKKLIKIPSASHGLCYPVAPEYYIEQVKAFFNE